MYEGCRVYERFAPDRSAQEAFAHVQELFADYDLRLTDSAGGARPGLERWVVFTFVALDENHRPRPIVREAPLA